MSQQRYLDFLRTAQAEGLLPESAAAPQHALVQWPIMLMTAIGAWLATIPLVSALHLVSGGNLAKGPGAFVVGILLLLTGLWLLRKENQSLFMEQFTLAALVLVGFVHLALGIRAGSSDVVASFLMIPVAVAVGWMAPRRWLQCGFGALACFLLLQGAAALLGKTYGQWTSKWWEAAHIALCIWILSHAILGRVRGQYAARIDAIAAGWGVALMIGLALIGGLESFFTGAVGVRDGGGHRELTPLHSQIISVLLTFAAAAWAGYRWPTVIQVRFALVAAVAAGLAWLMPALGGIFVVLAFCATSGRWILATTAGVAAVFTFSAFYYQLAVPLATKAMIMTAAGALLAAIVWMGHQRALPTMALKPGPPKGGGISIVAGMVIVLVAINASIWQKEHLISTGAPVLVELAPADPRSLIQGDYMRLRFVLPVINDRNDFYRGAKAVGQRDQRGVTRLTRFDDGSPLKPGELMINLVRKNGGLTLVTDAWFFAEGQAKRWEAARYGEFRVDSSGKALLVGLRDQNLRPIR